MTRNKWYRHYVVFPVALLLFASAAISPAAAVAAAPIRVTVNGQALTMDVPPTVRDGRTLVPMRAIFEALGAKVSWDPETKRITGSRGTTVIILHVGRTTATVGGRTIPLDVPPLVISGRALVPTRFISEHLGATVHWDGSARLVTVRDGAAPARPSPGDPSPATITLPDGSRYTGALRNGVPHGFGTAVAANGESYSGAWENGLRHGVGVLTFQNRTSRTGIWNRGELAQWLSPDPNFTQ